MIGLKERDPTQPNLTNLTGLLLNNIVCATVSYCVVCVNISKWAGVCSSIWVNATIPFLLLVEMRACSYGWV